MLIPERVKEMFALFASTIPKTASTKQNKVMEKRLGVSIDDLIRSSLVALSEDCLKNNENKEASEAYFDFISEAILYMKGESDDYPTIEIVNDLEIGQK